MKFGYFDDAQREYVITQPDTPLPWINYLGSEAYFGLISNTAGGYSFYRDARLRRILRYRYNNVPFDTGGRYPLPARRRQRRVLVAGVAAHAQAAGELHLPARHGLQRHRLAAQRDRGEHALFRPAGPESGDLAAVGHQSSLDAGQAIHLLSRRIQPMGCLGRCHKLPAQLQHRAGRSRRRRDLPQDRVSRAPRSLCLLRLLRAAGRVRHPARQLPGAYRGWDSPQVVERGASANSIAHGWAPIGSHHVDLSLQPGETRQVIFLLGYHENPRDQKFDPPGSQTIDKRTVKPIISTYLHPPDRGRGLRGVARPLERAAGDLPGADARRTHQSHGQPLECLPVHGDL